MKPSRSLSSTLLLAGQVSPENVFVTHGREEALLSFLKKKGYNCESLNLLGYEDEDD